MRKSVGFQQFKLPADEEFSPWVTTQNAQSTVNVIPISKSTPISHKKRSFSCKKTSSNKQSYNTIKSRFMNCFNNTMIITCSQQQQKQQQQFQLDIKQQPLKQTTFNLDKAATVRQNVVENRDSSCGRKRRVMKHVTEVKRSRKQNYNPRRWLYCMPNRTRMLYAHAYSVIGDAFL